jgi:hypothetical protein
LKINAFGSDAPTGSVAAADRIPQAESQAQPMLPVAIGAVIFDDCSVMSS